MSKTYTKLKAACYYFGMSMENVIQSNNKIGEDFQKIDTINKGEPTTDQRTVLLAQLQNVADDFTDTLGKLIEQERGVKGKMGDIGDIWYDAIRTAEAFDRQDNKHVKAIFEGFRKVGGAKNDVLSTARQHEQYTQDIVRGIGAVMMGLKDMKGLTNQRTQSEQELSIQAQGVVANTMEYNNYLRQPGST
jgi:hypothetical protein